MGFRVWGLGFGVWGLGFRVWGLGFGVRQRNRCQNKPYTALSLKPVRPPSLLVEVLIVPSAESMGAFAAPHQKLLMGEVQPLKPKTT